MKKGLRITLIVVLSAVFIYSGYSLITVLLEYRQGEELYAAAVQEFVKLPEEPAVVAPVEPASEPEDEAASEQESEPVSEPQPEPLTPEEMYLPPEVDFAGLKQANGDIAAWLWIPGTDISYPVLKGDDNQKYLTAAYDGNYSRLGSIFEDYRNADGFTDYNTIIYGHNMKNDAMFGALSAYKEQSFYDGHRFFYIVTEDTSYICRVYSAFTTQSDGAVYTMNFKNDEKYASFAQKMAGKSLVQAELVPDGVLPTVTLSTCTNTSKTGRFVVLATIEEYTVPDMSVSD